MKRIKYLLIIMLVLLFNVHVQADDTCSNDEFKRLKYLADKVELSYDYDFKVFKTEKEGNVVKEYKRPYFYIYANNLNKELKVMIEKDYLLGNYEEFEDNGKGIGNLGPFNEEEKIEVTIRAYTNNSCSGKVIAKKSIALPHFNIRYFSDVCIAYPNFKYCDLFLEREISDSEFTSEIEKYIDMVEKGEQEPLENQKSEKNDKENNSLVKILVTSAIIVTFAIFLLTYILKKRQNEL